MRYLRPHQHVPVNENEKPVTESASSAWLYVTRTRLFLLGMQTWIVLVLLPVLSRGTSIALTLVTGIASALLLGVALLLVRPKRDVAAWMLLLAFPLTLALDIAFHARDAHEEMPRWAMILGSILLVIYEVAATRVVHHHFVRDDVRNVPLAFAVAPPPTKTSRMRAILLTTTVLGSAMLLFGTSFVIDDERLKSAWGDAHREANVLATMLSVAITSSVIATIVGPGLRAPRAIEFPSRGTVRTRVIAATALAAAALFVFFAMKK